MVKTNPIKAAVDVVMAEAVEAEEEAEEEDATEDVLAEAMSEE